MPRSTFYYKPDADVVRQTKLDESVVEKVRGVIKDNPTYGVRRITAVLRNRMMCKVNRKKVRRIIRINNWQVRKKPQGNRPQAQGLENAS